MLIKLPAKDYTTRFVYENKTYIIEGYEIPEGTPVLSKIKINLIDLVWYWRNHVETRHNFIQLEKPSLEENIFTMNFDFRKSKVSVYFSIIPEGAYFKATAIAFNLIS